MQTGGVSSQCYRCRSPRSAFAYRRQLGEELPACLPSTVEKALLVKDRFAFQHKVDRTSQLMGQDGQRPSLVMFVERLNTTAY